MIIERDYPTIPMTEKKPETWIKGYNKWKKERCPHN